jgi:para-aminobenzoate synthetase
MPPSLHTHDTEAFKSSYSIRDEVMGRPRILFLDAYDSFSNNVVSLLTTLLEADVAILHIDSPLLDPTSPGFHSELRRELRFYDAVVCGPGPGSPDQDADVGLMRHIWQLEDDHLLPVLGICLGFQSLAVGCGANIRKIPGGGRHGMIRGIDTRPEAAGTCAGDVFGGVAPFKATLYHSLCADVGQASIPEPEWSQRKWVPPSHLPEIVPLAWVDEDCEDGSTERLLMGMKHASKPFWGLQYHPESVCSEAAGHQVIKNWFTLALNWSKQHGRSVVSRPLTATAGPTKPSLLEQSVTQAVLESERGVTPTDSPADMLQYAANSKYVADTIPLPSHIEVPDVVEILQSGKRDHIILDSASAHANRIGLDVRGRYSIIALEVDDSLRLEYHVGDANVIAQKPSSLGAGRQEIKLRDQQTVWHVLADFMDKRKLTLQDVESPFAGGFMGYITYELGLECIDVGVTSPRGHQRPDLCFAWITRSVVIDHLEGTLRIQHLHPSVPEAKEWVGSIASALQASSLWTDGLRVNDTKLRGTKDFTPPITPTGPSEPPTIVTPESREYEAKVRHCQELIAAGDSYELCLTDQTTITRPKAPLEAQGSTISIHGWAPQSAAKLPTSWQLYRELRARQPAPFGSYLRLGGATLISSSPERFLEYSAGGLCSMRPMKGTVRKSAAVATLEQAEAILHVSKEEAENLMIVDLVRHDLHSVCGPGRVRVPQLLRVEEYASVFQMISVVEGQLPAREGAKRGEEEEEEGEEEEEAAGGAPTMTTYTGLDVLAASLPPGSMTGAPKKRSCELLLDVEGGGGAHRERSLYSGVVGYMNVTGRGDWSVTIRSLFRWDDETARQPDGTDAEVWRIGAGGAVTALSTAEGERDEMFTKLKGPLGVFEDAS